MKIKVVFFDAGETLLYRNPSLTTIACRYLKKNKIKVKKETVDRFIKNAADEMKNIIEKAKLNDSEKWELFIKKFFRKIKINDSKKIKEIKEKLKSGTSFRKFSDVLNIFKFLKQNKIKIGIISNAPTELKKILKKTKLLHKIDFLIISENVGFEKPDRRIFEYALKVAKIKKEECIYVGDNYIADIKGAENAGIYPVWIVRDTNNAHFSYSEKEIKDIVKIKKLTEIKNLIKIAQ